MRKPLAMALWKPTSFRTCSAADEQAAGTCRISKTKQGRTPSTNGTREPPYPQPVGFTTYDRTFRIVDKGKACPGLNACISLERRTPIPSTRFQSDRWLLTNRRRTTVLSGWFVEWTSSIFYSSILKHRKFVSSNYSGAWESTDPARRIPFEFRICNRNHNNTIRAGADCLVR